MTKKEKLEIVRGSGNIFRDFGYPNADIEQLKAILAAQIIGILDDRKLSTRKAEKLTGVPHADFVRIRKPSLKRFTVDRLISILNKLDQQVDVKVKVRPRPRQKAKAEAAIQI
ncbi:MAG: XRE family transcriptional regulator [Nitrospinae bacterium CG11_big_fil_rev_8_21_14_0_20_56_8]|nr:MAG: XRE family transcriptional regulator [Nitrospinae bacterium CG11_big_fil_rev_8_21_14_0_20_56_8]